MTNARQVAPGDTQVADDTLRSEGGGSLNLTSWLDKPVTLRHCLRWLRRAIYVLLPVYVLLVFLNAWILTTGGVSADTSPFKDRIPVTCSGFVNRSLGMPAGRTLSDDLLLRERVRRFPLKSALKPEGRLLPCLGYAVLAGMHGDYAGDSDFTDVYVDADGKPVVSISVRFEQLLKEGVNE